MPIIFHLSYWSNLYYLSYLSYLPYLKKLLTKTPFTRMADYFSLVLLVLPVLLVVLILLDRGPPGGMGARLPGGLRYMSFYKQGRQGFASAETPRGLFVFLLTLLDRGLVDQSPPGGVPSGPPGVFLSY